MYSILLLSFLLGVSIGSFLNVVIYRTPRKMSVTGRSACPNCGHKLTAVELIPVASYLMQGRKCKSCSQKISPRYMGVELLTGVLFTIATYTQLNNLNWIALLSQYIIIATLITMSFIDYDTMEIPNEVHFIIIGIAMVLYIIGIQNNFLVNVISSLITGLVLFILAFITMGLGLGDVKLMIASGILIGPIANLYALILGGISAIVYAMIKGIKSKEPFPFGPFLAIGIYITIILLNLNVI